MTRVFTIDHRASRRQVTRRHLPWLGTLLTPVLLASWLPVPGPADGVFCVLRRVTGYPCLTCGFTRAFSRMAHGQWRDALRDCPLGAVLFLAFIGVLSVHLTAVLLGVRFEWNLPPMTRRQRGLALAALAGLAAANWAYRLIRGFA